MLTERDALAVADTLEAEYLAIANGEKKPAKISLEAMVRAVQMIRALESRASNAGEAVAWVALTDEDRTAAFESLPDMLEGFLKKWGWLHFAKEIERLCREKNARAAPAPASKEPVADERGAFEAKFPMPADCVRCGDGYAATGYNAWEAHEYVKMWKGWQARAAMSREQSKENDK